MVLEAIGWSVLLIGGLALIALKAGVFG